MLQILVVNYYLNSKIFYQREDNLMIRQKSMCIIKPIVKERPNVLRKQSLKEFKPDILQHKILTQEVQLKKDQGENKIKIKKEKKSCGLSKERSKTKINIKEQKMSHEKHDTHKHKIQNQQKQSSSINRPICIKNDLKALMTKNITKNRQSAEVQIEMLRKIEKVKQNRRMNDIKQRNKTSNITTKKNSPINDKLKQKSSKVKKVKNQSTQRSEEPGQISPSKNHKKVQESQKLKYHFGIKNARFSLEYPLGVKRSQIEDALLIKPKKDSKVSNNIPSSKSNFLELFKNYKKSFQIDSIKLDKSIKKNQNNIQGFQSKNNSSVSSIFSSRKAMFNGQQKQDIVRKDQIIDESSNSQFAKILNSQTFQKQQLFKSKMGNKTIDNLNIQAPIRPEIMFKKLKTQEVVNDFASKKINMDEIRESDSFSVEIQEEGQEKIVPFEIFRQQSPTKIDSKESSSIQHIKNKQNTTQVSQPFSEVDRHKLQKNFESSKYYVQPIPTFKTKLSGSSLQLQSPIINKDINDSLIGYQIELIQKNILVDQDEFEL